MKPYDLHAPAQQPHVAKTSKTNGDFKWYLWMHYTCRVQLFVQLEEHWVPVEHIQSDGISFVGVDFYDTQFFFVRYKLVEVIGRQGRKRGGDFGSQLPPVGQRGDQTAMRRIG